jgi:hypothetical protein
MPSEAAIRAMYEKRTGKPAPTLNGVTLGPRSPLREAKPRILAPPPPYQQ